MTEEPLTITIHFERAHPHEWVARVPEIEGVTGRGATIPEATQSLLDVLCLTMVRGLGFVREKQATPESPAQGEGE